MIDKYQYKGIAYHRMIFMSTDTTTNEISSKENKSSETFKDAVNGMKSLISSAHVDNFVKLKKYGRVFIVQAGQAIPDSIPWDYLKEFEQDNVMLIISFNPINSRMEFDFFHVQPDVYKDISYFAHRKNRHIGYAMNRSEYAMKIFTVFFTPEEANVKNCDAILEQLKTIRQYYPSKYRETIGAVMDHTNKSMSIICNNQSISDELRYYGWEKMTIRETAFIIC